MEPTSATEGLCGGVPGYPSPSDHLQRESVRLEALCFSKSCSYTLHCMLHRCAQQLPSNCHAKPWKARLSPQANLPTTIEPEACAYASCHAIFSAAGPRPDRGMQLFTPVDLARAGGALTTLAKALLLRWANKKIRQVTMRPVCWPLLVTPSPFRSISC